MRMSGEERDFEMETPSRRREREAAGALLMPGGFSMVRRSARRASNATDGSSEARGDRPRRFGG
jgi:hypothetical protein